MGKNAYIHPYIHAYTHGLSDHIALVNVLLMTTEAAQGRRDRAPDIFQYTQATKIAKSYTKITHQFNTYHRF